LHFCIPSRILSKVMRDLYLAFCIIHESDRRDSLNFYRMMPQNVVDYTSRSRKFNIFFWVCCFNGFSSNKSTFTSLSLFGGMLLLLLLLLFYFVSILFFLIFLPFSFSISNSKIPEIISINGDSASSN